MEIKIDSLSFLVVATFFCKVQILMIIFIKRKFSQGKLTTFFM